MQLKQNHFTLANFEGHLNFLICLIQNEEIEIGDVPIQNLIQQFLHQLNFEDEGLDNGAEFIGSAAHLILLKSKALLPKGEQDVEEAVAEDPQFEIIHHLLEYCRFKQAAKELSSRQNKQLSCYFRGIETPNKKKPLGIDHVSLEELSVLFKDMMSKVDLSKPQIQEEHWKVSDKIKIIRNLLKEQTSFPFIDLFSYHQSRKEMIVIFLAVLELMKIGELMIGRDQATCNLWVSKGDI